MMRELLRVTLNKRQIDDALGEYAAQRVALAAGTFSVEVVKNGEQADVIFSKKRERKVKAIEPKDPE